MEVNIEDINREESTKLFKSTESISEPSFSNEQVKIDSIPKIEDVVFEPLQQSSMYVELIVIGITTLIFLIIAAIIAFFWDDAKPYILYAYLLILVFMGLVTFSQIKGFKNAGFALREKDILFRSGWLWQSIIVVPYSRIQHMEVHQGPIDRLFDLGAITLFTAGGSNSDIDIEGILPAQAESIKAYILSKNKSIEVNSDDESE